MKIALSLIRKYQLQKHCNLPNIVLKLFEEGELGEAVEVMMQMKLLKFLDKANLARRLITANRFDLCIIVGRHDATLQHEMIAHCESLSLTRLLPVLVEVRLLQ